MNDSQRITRLERELEQTQAQLAKALLALAELTRRAESGRKSTQSAVNGLNRDIGLIYQNVKVPNVHWNPATRYVIE